MLDLVSRVAQRHREAAVSTRGLAMMSWGTAGSRQILLYDGDVMKALMDLGVDAFWDAWGDDPDVFRGFCEVKDAASACGNVYTVGPVISKRGYGPLLYDIALTYARRDNMAGVIPDRGSITPGAKAIWKYYAERRTDVTITPLENLGPSCRAYPEDFLNNVYATKRPLQLGTMLATHKNLARLAEQIKFYEYETHLFAEGYGHWQNWALVNK